MTMSRALGSHNVGLSIFLRETFLDVPDCRRLLQPL